ncbi:hypothetical protein [Rossellomorea sp. BNER]|uniref:hypothetical protein n=1 Tax=Rossellomorea sp. BNER TaxID=2962031 RepID=UPI003AF26398|nr:DUF1269 domain-containing protein [Rossellomorea sp. BNER]
MAREKQTPDFDELNDRVIAEMPQHPSLVIKTNLDPKDATEENPYYHNKNKDQFEDYFKE